MYATHIINQYINHHNKKMDSKEYIFTAVPYGPAAMPALYTVPGKL